MASSEILTFEGLVRRDAQGTSPSQLVSSLEAKGDFPRGVFSFSPRTFALVSDPVLRGDGNFSGTNTIIASFDNPSITLTLEGFGELASGELRFRYTSPFVNNNRVILRDRNGRELVNNLLPSTPSNLGYNISPSTNPLVTIPFTGNLATIEFRGVQNQLGIDDIQLTNVVFVTNRAPVVTLSQPSFSVGQNQPNFFLPTITLTDDRGLASVRITAPNGTRLNVPNDRNSDENVIVLDRLSGTSLNLSNISFISPLALTNQSITIVATDNEGLSSAPVNLNFNVQATPVNALPEFRNLPAPIGVGLNAPPQSFSFSIFDQDSDRAYLILNAPQGVTLTIPGGRNIAPNRVEFNNVPITEINQSLQQAKFSSTVPGEIKVDLFLDDLSSDRSGRPVARQPGIIFNVGSERPIVRGLEPLITNVGTPRPLGVSIQDDSAELNVILEAGRNVVLEVPTDGPLRDRDNVPNNNYVDLRGTVEQINQTLQRIQARGLVQEEGTLSITVQDERNNVRERKDLRFTEAVVVSIRSEGSPIKEPIGNETAREGRFVISRTGSTAEPLTVGVSLSGIGNNAEKGRDFRFEPDITDRVTIPAGASSLTIRVIPLADDLVEGNKSINFSLLPGNTFNLGNSTASITIEDTPPLVSVRATDSEAQEGGLSFNPNPGRFTITRTGLTTNPLTVSFSLAGTATIGVDYQTVPLSVTIPAGQTSANIDITPIADNLIEGNETVILNLTEDRSKFVLGTDRSATVTIADRRPGIANVVATQPRAERPPVDNRPGIFTISRPTRPDGVQDTTGDFLVNFRLSGSADFNRDYDILPSNSNGFSFSGNQGQIVIRDARGAETITIVPKTDNDNTPGDETVTLTVVDGNSATVTIVETRPIVTVEAIDPNAKEPPISGLQDVTVDQNQTVVRFRDNVVEDGDRIRVALNGVIVNNDLLLTNSGTDITFNLLPGVNVLEITALNQGGDPPDAALNTTEISIAGVIQTGRGLATGETVTLNIINTSTAANSNAVSAGSSEFAGIFRITRSGANNSQDLLVTYNLTGTAANGTDYARLDSSVIIPAGQNFVDVIVSPLADNLFESAESVILTITSSVNYTIGAQSNATVTIEDGTTLPTVIIRAVDSLAIEPSVSSGTPDVGTFVISRSGGDLSQPLTVSLSIDGTATNGTDYSSIPSSFTIPAGETAITIPITPLFDTLVEGNETVVLSLASSSNYTIGSANTATVTIQDTVNLPTVTIVATDATATEPISSSVSATDTGLFTITRSGGDLSQPLTVNLSIGGTAQNGTDYTTISPSVVIPANQTSATISIVPLFDTSTDNNETVILSLVSNPSYTIGSASSATVTIQDFVISVGNNIIGTDSNDTISATSSTGVTGTPDNFATAFNDTIAGLDGNDSISGLDGNDTIDGGDGSDTIAGGAGNDTIDGGDGSDTIAGGAGNDTIRGGDDTDTLIGGLGADVFQIEDSDGDIITDFSLSDGDTIQLLSSNYPGGTGTLSSLQTSASIDIGINTNSSLASSFAPGQNSPIGGVGKPAYFYEATTGRLLLDRDGSSTSFAFELIANLPPLPPVLSSSLFNNISIGAF